MAKVVLLAKGKHKFPVTKTGYETSRAHYEAIGAIPVDEAGILAHENVVEEIMLKADEGADKKGEAKTDKTTKAGESKNKK